MSFNLFYPSHFTFFVLRYSGFKLAPIKLTISYKNVVKRRQTLSDSTRCFYLDFHEDQFEPNYPLVLTLKLILLFLIHSLPTRNTLFLHSTSLQLLLLLNTTLYTLFFFIYFFFYSTHSFYRRFI